MLGIFGSKTRANILGWLFTHQGERYFGRQLSAILKDDPANVSRELARLEKMGLLVCESEGVQKYYQANKSSPVFEELHGLALKTVGIAEVLKKALSSVSREVNFAFIFGSMAAGMEDKFSDIDLLIIGKIDPQDVSTCIGDAGRQLKREINPVVYSPEEFKKKIRGKNHFVRSVLAGKKIFIAGSDNDIARLAG